MKVQTKIDLVEEIIGTVQKDMIENLKKGKVPEGWDGVELRWWISDKMKNVVQNSRHPVENRARYSDYINDRLIGGF